MGGPILRRVAFDWEIPSLCNLLDRLSPFILLNQDDRRRWLLSADGNFSTKACYKLFDLSRDMGIPWKQIWCHLIPLKVQFFIWTASLEKISILNILGRKGMYLPNIFLVCYGNGESASHILIHYPFAEEVWDVG